MAASSDEIRNTRIDNINFLLQRADDYRVASKPDFVRAAQSYNEAAGELAQLIKTNPADSIIPEYVKKIEENITTLAHAAFGKETHRTDNLLEQAAIVKLGFLICKKLLPAPVDLELLFTRHHLKLMSILKSPTTNATLSEDDTQRALAHLNAVTPVSQTPVQDPINNYFKKFLEFMKQDPKNDISSYQKYITALPDEHLSSLPLEAFLTCYLSPHTYERLSRTAWGKGHAGWEPIHEQYLRWFIIALTLDRLIAIAPTEENKKLATLFCRKGHQFLSTHRDVSSLPEYVKKMIEIISKEGASFIDEFLKKLDVDLLPSPSSDSSSSPSSSNSSTSFDQSLEPSEDLASLIMLISLAQEQHQGASPDLVTAAEIYHTALITLSEQLTKEEIQDFSDSNTKPEAKKPFYQLRNDIHSGLTLLESQIFNGSNNPLEQALMLDVFISSSNLFYGEAHTFLKEKRDELIALFSSDECAFSNGDRRRALKSLSIDTSTQNVLLKLNNSQQGKETSTQIINQYLLRFSQSADFSLRGFRKIIKEHASDVRGGLNEFVTCYNDTAPYQRVAPDFYSSEVESAFRWIIIAATLMQLASQEPLHDETRKYALDFFMKNQEIILSLKGHLGSNFLEAIEEWLRQFYLDIPRPHSATSQPSSSSSTQYVTDYSANADEILLYCETKEKYPLLLARLAKSPETKHFINAVKILLSCDATLPEISDDSPLVAARDALFQNIKTENDEFNEKMLNAKRQLEEASETSELTIRAIESFLQFSGSSKAQSTPLFKRLRNWITENPEHHIRLRELPETLKIIKDLFSKGGYCKKNYKSRYKEIFGFYKSQKALGTSIFTLFGTPSSYTPPFTNIQEDLNDEELAKDTTTAIGFHLQL
jgi:hypothetical protein